MNRLDFVGVEKKEKDIYHYSFLTIINWDSCYNDEFILKFEDLTEI